MKKQFSLSRLSVICLLSSVFVLSSCGAKKTISTATPTPIPRELVITDDQKPTIKLTPRQDGHELTLTISQINSLFIKIEYELIYTAVDGGLEIEKGVSGNIESKDILNGTAERKILLGTESCTNGCKYKYDSGINGGSLNLTLITEDNQVASLEMPFTLTSSKGKNFTITFR
ncbi:hypothetical protein CO009_02530 [Candidatus Shapirobacteria bacterium CG_4_8_14_3_um_filter_35_11]|uniref:Cohesin domain-containing protein n=6 Tax=Candidatus Shapironibacteriota TaxID=1752721 RepID=A0A1J5HPX6_9BACT|nr:MAG: hypothetical protein AUK05_01410 [Candidatus Shapirobacteria bacterium CG2_30_35_20]PIV07504.1 MAG: hypothetical protein COS53_02040 [Candidatus Shapirobacteria bacterium CG03_land_8_20_14_0_80_35_14]PIX68258.1 MAG: hypothetical protein COZ41_00625 [Candidatus Shapirobacteria bacterium CG_4_10_14_3_um_filter_35_13]PJA50747.1 MAG: hypothetical protein CO168_03370 [Candidatus Shapirobacteria bacterium CG_4_9_14_3_um_filter_36_12]PJC80214.1 MAG: hypothetical protein CO009_02530 [Candidatus